MPQAVMMSKEIATEIAVAIVLVSSLFLSDTIIPQVEGKVNSFGEKNVAQMLSDFWGEICARCIIAPNSARAGPVRAAQKEDKKEGDFSPECRLTLGLSRAFDVSGLWFDFRFWRLLRLGVLCFSLHPALLLYHKMRFLSIGFLKILQKIFLKVELFTESSYLFRKMLELFFCVLSKFFYLSCTHYHYLTVRGY